MPNRALHELQILSQRRDLETRRLIVEAAGAGASSQQIADAIGISRATLWRRYKPELQETPSPGGAQTPRPA